MRRRFLAIADLAAAVAAGTAVFPEAGLWGVALAPMWLVPAKLLGLYDRDHKVIRHLTVDEVAYLALWGLSGAALLAVVLPVVADAHLGSSQVGLVALVGFGATTALRGAARWLWRRVVPPERTALLGEGELAEITRRKLRLFPDMHLELAADLPLDDLSSAAEADALASLFSNADRIIVAADSVDPEFIATLTVRCREHNTKLSVASNLRGRALPVPQMTQVAELPVFEFDTWDVPRSTMLIKRCFDLAASIVGLVLLSPVMAVVAVAIKLDDRGPLLFSQRRAGLGGRPFRMLKFRTMGVDAEARLGEVVEIEELPEPVFKLSSDPRTTRVGRVLRRLSLDEIPQLVHVLLGQMSIVGPRPEQIELVERYGPEHVFRMQVKPGVTGPMQIYGRGDLTLAERVAVEVDYVDNISLPRDLKIIALTIPAIVRGRGAY